MHLEAVPSLSPVRPVICIGGVVWESNFSVDHFPGRGVKLLPRDARQMASGMAPAAAATLARLGQAVELWSVVGDDGNGANACADLAREGIGVAHVQRLQGAATPFSSVLVDPAGERLVVPFFDPALYGAAALESLPLHRVAQAAAVLADLRWVDGAEAVLRQARADGVPTVLDADVAPRAVLERLLPLADHVLFSEVALHSLEADGAPREALLRVAARLEIAQVVGVTLGEHGALIWQRGQRGAVAHFAAPPIRAVDTLNAGDVWHGAYVHGLVAGLDMAARIPLANMAAAIKCERPWGRLGAPTLAEVRARLG